MADAPSKLLVQTNSHLKSVNVIKEKNNQNYFNMSDYESHEGKIRKVIPREGENFQELCKRISLEKGAKEEDYYVGYLFDELYDIYVRGNDETLYEVFDHSKRDPSASYCDFIDNGDGTFSFSTMFYNGGTCLSEMLGKKLKKL